MVKRIFFSLVVLLLGSMLILRAQPLVLASPDFQGATPTPAAEEEPTDEHAAEPTIHDLLARVEALEAQVAALTDPATSAAQVNQVTTAVYLLDNAGLHDLDVRLNDEGVIEPSDSGRVARIARLLSTVDWPHDMAADAEMLNTILTDLSAALAEDDLESAAPLATEAHDVGHDLSHAADHWLGEGSAASHDAPGQVFRVTAAVYLLDNAGLHDLDVRLNDEGVIEPSDSGRVARIGRLLSTVDWPHEMAADAEMLNTILTDLSAALAEDDLETAAPLATEAHDVGHDLSHGAEHWLSTQSGAHDDHGDESMHEEGDDHSHEENDDHSQDEESKG